MFLSFVIPTYNRESLLGMTVPVLAALEIAPGDEYEVIFVDNGSTDSSPEMLKAAAERYPERIRYIRIAPTGGPSAPRNTGIRAARGEVLVILDDDVLPDSDIALRYAEFHRQYPERHHAAVGTIYWPEIWKDDPMAFIHADNTFLRGRENISYLYFWTCNVSLKRDFMLEAGMFDERFLYYEDALCAYQMQRKGMKLHFWESARGEHWHPITPDSVATKGLFFGRWQPSFLDRVGRDPEALEVLQVLDKRLGPWKYAKRWLEHSAFRFWSSAPIMWLSKLRLARNPKRTRFSEQYYRKLFRKYAQAGYYEAQRSAEAGHPLDLINLKSKLAERGE